ncbi:MAG TPA: VWA domain-containing protein [Candidatus Binatia bacterium]
MRERLLSFVTRLRAVGIRVSIAETLDAMAAVEAVGVEREVLREALAAALVKDENDRAAFDAAFDEHFPLLPLPASGGRSRKRGRRGAAGDDGHAGAPSGGSGGGGGGAPRASEERERRDDARPTRAPAVAQTASQAASRALSSPHEPRVGVRAGEAPRAKAESARPRAERPADSRHAALPARHGPVHDRPGAPPPPPAPLRQRPFADLDPDELDRARAVARELGRRFAARTSRRERRERRGHVDIRRTIRHAVARGGALIDLQRRGRRPGKPNLVVLCDVSGSVARASDLLLTILAGAESAFARVTRFAFVDRLVPIDFEDGHVRPEGELDYHAYSDHGAALADLEAQAERILDRRTVLLVLGDARNNRRPARADVLRRLARRVRAVVWAVPEPRERWNTGDSALAAYAESADLVLEATSLTGLLAALREAARR